MRLLGISLPESNKPTIILENTSLSKINATKDVLAEIAQVVQECAQFIVKYSETKRFCTSTSFVES